MPSSSDELRRRQIGPGHDEALDALGHAITEWVIPFLKSWVSAGRQPIPAPEDVATIRSMLEEWSRTKPLPDGYAALPKLLASLAEALRFNSHNFVNIHPTPHVPSVVASLAVMLQNPNNIVEEVSGPTTAMERECIAWIAKNLVGFNPDNAWGNIVSGGTIANMTALMVARDYCFRKLALPRPAEVRSRGLYGLQPGVVLATAGSHYSVRKALWFLGMGDENVVSIPVAYDEVVERQGRRDKNFVEGISDSEWSGLIESAIRADRRRGEEEFDAFYSGAQTPFSLQPLDSQILKALYTCFAYSTPLIAYVFTLGTTDTGTIEKPSSAALERLVHEDVFIHADAAAGGFALSHHRLKQSVGGLARVHSVAIDAHKFGHLAYPNGALVFRERGWMHEIMHEAPYLSHLAPTLEGSRPGFHAAALWMAIQDLGITGRYHQWLDRLFTFVDQLVEAFRSTNKFQVLHKVDLTTVAVAPVPLRSETRRAVNAIVERVFASVLSDHSSGAFLVNLDRGLSGIKVRNGSSDSDFVDIYCLRIVVINPIIESLDAERLVSYLEAKLAFARRQ